MHNKKCVQDVEIIYMAHFSRFFYKPKELEFITMSCPPKGLFSLGSRFSSSSSFSIATNNNEILIKHAAYQGKRGECMNGVEWMASRVTILAIS